MKMFLTRLGEDAKMIVTGDPTQKRPEARRSFRTERGDGGILDGVESVAIVRFTGADVVRHPLVQRIVDAYERDQGDADLEDTDQAFRCR